MILATGDPRALGLYLRFGVGYATTSVDLFRAPRALAAAPARASATPSGPASNLTFERLAPGRAGVEAVAAIELAVLGHRRDADIEFLLERRPGWIAHRDGAPAGIAFGAQGANSGPIAALDPADQPALLDHVEREAHAAGIEELYFSVPMINHVAVDHLLAGGFRIDPFYVHVLADSASMQLDRWVHTGPAFIL